MLDILGNVFGRSKKDKTGATTATASTPAEAGSSDGFAVVGHDPAGGQVPFIYPTMLTNEMLRPSPASPAASATSPSSATTSAAASSSNRTPFSSDPASSYDPVNQNTNTWNSHADNLTLLRNHNMNGINQINAMDQVPFVPHAAYADPSRSTASADTRGDEMRRCYATIDRVSGLLAAPSQSDYNFEVERNVIRESSVSSWQMFT